MVDVRSCRKGWVCGGKFVFMRMCRRRARTQMVSDFGEGHVQVRGWEGSRVRCSGGGVVVVCCSRGKRSDEWMTFEGGVYPGGLKRTGRS